jgi:hypothetical protein
MKPNTDKILRDKIESLDTLPGNYNGSIESKWELLRAGMQSSREEKFPLFRLAASIIMVTGLMVWMIYLTGRDSNQVTHLKNQSPAIQKENLQIPSVKTEVSGQVEQQKTVTIKVPIPAVKIETPTPQKNNIESPNVPQENSLITLQNPEEKFVENEAVPEPVIAEVTVLKNKTGSKPKKRYVEIQFGQTQQVIAENKPEKKSFSFKMRLLPAFDPPKTTVLANEDSPPIRVQIPF